MFTAPDPSLETKQELKENGITCLSEFGQAARFLLHHSGSQENLHRTARNFVAQDKTIDSTGNVVTKLQLLLSELEVKTDRTFSCFENVSKVVTRLQECNAMVMPREQAISGSYVFPSPSSSLATPVSTNTLTSTTAPPATQEKQTADTLIEETTIETRGDTKLTTLTPTQEKKHPDTVTTDKTDKQQTNLNPTTEVTPNTETTARETETETSLTTKPGEQTTEPEKVQTDS